jgi:hypothetical protein
MNISNIKRTTKTIGKKGIAYMAVSILFLGIVYAVFYSSSDYSQREKQRNIEIRIMAIDDFIEDFHNDAQRAVYITGYRSLIGMEDYVSSHGVFLQHPRESFREVFYYGTINSTYMAVMNNSEFQEYERRINANADKINVHIELNVTSIELYHTDPWHINVIVFTNVNITDNTNIAEWDYNTTFSTKVPVFDVRDPLYSVNTKGKVQKPVKRFNMSFFVDDSDNKNDTTNLQYMVNNSLYVNNTNAPSFLMRFSNNLSSSPYGIESFVNLPELSAQSIDIDNDKSVVDYIYFSNRTTSNKCSIQNMVYVPDWFKVDTTDNHLAFYEIQGNLDYINCP